MIAITYLDSKNELQSNGSYDNAVDARRAVEALIANGSVMSGHIYWNEGDVHKAVVWDGKGNKSYTLVKMM
jgi:hypothetical protein